MSVRMVLEDANYRGFSFPHEVVDDPSLSPSRKREILAEWASDACAVPSFPTLRRLPGTTFPVTFSSIMDARFELDRRRFAEPSVSDEPMGQVIAANFARRRGGGRALH